MLLDRWHGTGLSAELPVQEKSGGVKVVVDPGSGISLDTGRLNPPS